MNILYEDRHLVVLDKPVGIPVIPPREGGASVATETGYLVCHRLDTDTSGCLVMAKTAAGHRMMNLAFSEGRVRKTYTVVAEGNLPEEGEVRLAIGTWRRGRVSVGEGKSAITRYRVEWRRGTLLGALAWPLTGRTHQIRAHFSAAGAPLVGDPTYGGPIADRLMLHAWQVELPWPRPGDRLCLSAPIPFSFINSAGQPR